jgi:hypothetical protein
MCSIGSTDRVTLSRAFHAWLAARTRYRAAGPKAPDYEWLRREMERLCIAYEAAVSDAHGP